MNSYRSAGAALLQAMNSYRDGKLLGDGLSTCGHVAPACGSLTSISGALAPGGGGGKGGLSLILSTSPGKQSGVDGPQWGGVAAQAAGVGVAHAWSGAGTACSGGSLPKASSCDTEPRFDYGGQGECTLVAALGLLGGQAEPCPPSEVPAVGSQDVVGCEDVLGVSTLSGSMVRNTFIDIRPRRSPSMERFFEERKCRSSPTSRPLSRQASGSSLRFNADFECPFSITTPTDSAFPTPKHTYAPRGSLVVEASPASGSPPVLRLAQFISEAGPQATEGPAETIAAAAARLAQEFQHQECSPTMLAAKGAAESGSDACSTAATSAPGSALFLGVLSGASSMAGGSGLVPRSTEVPCDAAVAALGTVEIPSRGSALHTFGACKPCAFSFQDVCVSGVECEFCHLCDPGERKRRKKERRKLAASWKNRLGHEER